MRTHLNLDDELLAKAKKWGKHETTTAAVNSALREYVRQLACQGLLDLGGKVKWVGDLAAMRRRRIQR